MNDPEETYATLQIIFARLDTLATFARLVRHFWRQGWAGRRFFWRILGTAFRRSPRIVPQVSQFLGMYKHFCELHAVAPDSPAWNPWAAPPERSARPPAISSWTWDAASAGRPGGWRSSWDAASWVSTSSAR